MILDTSALVAIFFAEPEADQFLTAIHATDICRLSAASFVELFIVLESHAGSEAARKADIFLERAEIVIEPVTAAQAAVARQAFLDFGKGRHLAGLNYGDCFAYALARTLREPLLYKGNDFGRTDIAAFAP